MTDVHCRPLNPSEWQLLREMRIRAATLHPTLFYDTPQTAIDRPIFHWQNLLTTEGNKFWALFDGNKCIGITGIITVLEDTSRQTAMIGYTFIEPAYRGKGWADGFYKMRIDHAMGNAVWSKIITDHRIGNEASQKLILKYGFHLTEKVMIDWPDGSRDYELRYVMDLEKMRGPSL